MTAKGGSSGFDADKFRKLVAMFDSDYTEEAVTAFRLAVAELKKKQLRFCDRLVDSDEARELAEIECAKVRDELTRVLDQCARREADVDDAHEIIDRLHKRIASMENRATAKAATYRPKNNTEDQKAAPPSPAETETEASENWDTAPPPPITQTPDETGQEGYRLPALPVWKAAYWLALLCFVYLYACAVAVRGHMVTLSEWQQPQDVTTGFAILLGIVVPLYVMGWKWGFSQTRLGQWCIRNTGSVRDMLAGLFVVIFLGCMAYAYFVATTQTQLDEIGLSLFGIVGAVFAAFYLQHLLKNFGWSGVGIKVLMWLDWSCIGVSLLLGKIPWWNDFRHTQITHDHMLQATVFVTVWGLLCILDTPTRWAIEHKKVREIVTLPALFFLSYGAVMIADYKVEGHKAPPAAIERAQPSHTHPKRGAMSVAPPPYSPVLLATLLVTPQRYTYQPRSYPNSNADIVRGWGHDLKAFFDDLLGKEVEEWIIGLIALRWLWKAGQNAQDRRAKRKAIYRALNPPMPPNIHGDAGIADVHRAKRQGWL